MDVPRTVEITITAQGFDVALAGRVTRFVSLEDAVDFAQQKLRSAQQLRELSRRCE